jgi:hypothetical protein
MFNLINIHSFIPVSVCVGGGSSPLLWMGAYYAVKTALVQLTMKLFSCTCV